MGLSNMFDMDTKQLKYAMHFYNRPEFGKWQTWFAWYPVRIVTFKEVELSTFGVATAYLKVYKWTWLHEIVRRKVVDDLSGPGREGAGNKTYYEYTTLMDLLR